LVSARISQRFPHSGKRSSHDSVPESRFFAARRAICRDITGLQRISGTLLPLTFAAVVLLATAKLVAPGRRLAQLVYWMPALQLALGTYHLPGRP
jgi:hypothetical protein